ncbi:hypothetical protein [Actinomadura sp.]|uniref:hypothetical protein n=2 Tax=Actinomadura sp. TaxID=1989 RepID=UPI0037CB877C
MSIMNDFRAGRIQLGRSSGSDAKLFFGVIGAAAAALFIAVGLVAMIGGSFVGLPVLILGAGLGPLHLANAIRGFKGRAAAASPATLDSEGFTLALDGRRLAVPWREVYKVAVFRQQIGLRGKRLVVTSLTAILYADSPYRSEPLVERFGQVLGVNRGVWLGEITTAKRSVDVILAATREWLGVRFDAKFRELGSR